jgi:hypothetical protein
MAGAVVRVYGAQEADAFLRESVERESRMKIALARRDRAAAAAGVDIESGTTLMPLPSFEGIRRTISDELGAALDEYQGEGPKRIYDALKSPLGTIVCGDSGEYVLKVKSAERYLLTSAIARIADDGKEEHYYWFIPVSRGGEAIRADFRSSNAFALPAPLSSHFSYGPNWWKVATR